MSYSEFRLYVFIFLLFARSARLEINILWGGGGLEFGEAKTSGEDKSEAYEEGSNYNSGTNMTYVCSKTASY